MTTPEGTELSRKKQVARSLYKKANMLASCHSVLSDRYSHRHTILMSVLLAFSTLVVGLTFISEQFVLTTTGLGSDTLTWIRGTASIVVFAAGLLVSQWDWAGKAAKHREAVRHYFLVAHRARFLLEAADEQPITDEAIHELQTQYERSESLPKIPEVEFLKLKQQHLRKLAISRDLEKSPHSSIADIQKRLSALEQQARDTDKH